MKTINRERKLKQIRRPFRTVEIKMTTERGFLELAKLTCRQREKRSSRK